MKKRTRGVSLIGTKIKERWRNFHWQNSRPLAGSTLITRGACSIDASLFFTFEYIVCSRRPWTFSTGVYIDQPVARSVFVWIIVSNDGFSIWIRNKRIELRFHENFDVQDFLLVTFRFFYFSRFDYCCGIFVCRGFSSFIHCWIYPLVTASRKSFVRGETNFVYLSTI